MKNILYGMGTLLGLTLGLPFLCVGIILSTLVLLVVWVISMPVTLWFLIRWFSESGKPNKIFIR